MLKRIITFLVAFTLIISLSPTANAASKFKDVDLYKAEIEFLTSKGIIKGYEGGYFKPSESIKRLQAVQMILREKKLDASSMGVNDPGFIDLRPGDYGYNEVALAVELGFISGKTNSKNQKYFDPYGTLTRGQMAKILSLAYSLTGTYNGKFKDVTDKQLLQYVNLLAANNITTGYSDGTFRPYSQLSRQHFAAFMARLLDVKFRPSPENSRYNPAPLGEIWSVQGEDSFYGYQSYNIGMIDAITDGDLAWQMLLDANMFNESPPPGKKYILAKFYFQLVDIEDEPFYAYSSNFDAVSKSGVVYDTPIVVEPEPAFAKDIYKGGEIEGWVAFLVDENDEPLIVWERDLGGELWFSLK